MYKLQHVVGLDSMSHLQLARRLVRIYGRRGILFTDATMLLCHLRAADGVVEGPLTYGG